MRSLLYLLGLALRDQGAYPSPDGSELQLLVSPTGRIVAGTRIGTDAPGGVTPGTVTASRALVPDANKDLASLRHLTLTGNLRKSNASVAAAGTTQANATALTADMNYVTGADDSAGVALPDAVIGDMILVTNSVTNKKLKVYPINGGNDQIDSLTASTGPITLLPGETIIFSCESATQWRTNGFNRVASGVATTASASDTIVTGLRAVRAAFATYQTDPADANDFVSASIGDQAGTPAAGSILLKTWKSADGADVTPVAASAFSKAVNWLAIGS